MSDDGDCYDAWLEELLVVMYADATNAIWRSEKRAAAFVTSSPHSSPSCSKILQKRTTIFVLLAAAAVIAVALTLIVANGVAPAPQQPSMERVLVVFRILASNWIPYSLRSLCTC